MFQILSHIVWWSIPHLSNSLPVNILIGVSLYYCLYILTSIIYVRAYNSYLYYQLPGIPYRRYIAFIVGNAEIYLFDMNYLKRTRILRQMFEICMFIPEFLDVGVCRFSVAFQKFVILFRPDTVEDLFNSMSNIEKARQYEFFSNWLGLGLLTSTGEKWKRHRKLLTPAFHFKILESFIPVMNESSEAMLNLFDLQMKTKSVSFASPSSTSTVQKHLHPDIDLNLLDRANNNVLDTNSNISKEDEKIEAESLNENYDSNSNKENVAVDIRTYIGNCTLDTICETAMGIKIGAQSIHCDQSAYIGPVNRVLINTIFRGMEPLLHNDIIFALSSRGRQNSDDLKIIHKFVMNVIQERMTKLKKHLQENNIRIDQIGAGDEIESFSRKERYAFLDLLIVTHLKFPEQFTLKDILDEVQTFMFEGHDTTSSGLTFALLLIASDQRVQEKIFEELENIFTPVEKSSSSSSSHDGRKDNQNVSESLTNNENITENSRVHPLERQISMDDCRQMKYLDMVIKECLRLYPPVPFIARKITKQFTVDGRILPKGCTCMVPIYLLHRDPKTFPNPEHFLPERFEGDALNRSNPYAYVPFSAGARNCIGQKFAMLEMKIVLSSIIRKYRLKSLVHRDEVDTVMSVVTKADSPILIQFDKRRPVY